jgi:hypothetical protein
MKIRSLIVMGVALLAGRGAIAESVSVSATKALRVGWVETSHNSRGKLALRQTFAPVFRVALEGIYGAQTDVEFIELSINRAADQMGANELDAVLLFSPKLTGHLARLGGHVLRAESIARPGQFVAFLITPEIQPGLERLLADAFSASINNFDVRRVLSDAPSETELASW